jgi:hypothetical protein
MALSEGDDKYISWSTLIITIILIVLIFTAFALSGFYTLQMKSHERKLENIELRQQLESRNNPSVSEMGEMNSVEDQPSAEEIATAEERAEGEMTGGDVRTMVEKLAKVDDSTPREEYYRKMNAVAQKPVVAIVGVAGFLAIYVFITQIIKVAT